MGVCSRCGKQFEEHYLYVRGSRRYCKNCLAFLDNLSPCAKCGKLVSARSLTMVRGMRVCALCAEKMNAEVSCSLCGKSYERSQMKQVGLRFLCPSCFLKQLSKESEDARLKRQQELSSFPKKIRCPQCGSFFEHTGSLLCPACLKARELAKHIMRVCPRCGTPSIGKKFCEKCGTQLFR